MGYNHAAAFAPPLTLIEMAMSKEFQDAHYKKIEEQFFPPKPKTFDIVSTPINIGKTNTQLLNLRTRWLNAFLIQLEAINPEIPRDVAIEWANVHFPKTAAELVASINSTIPEKLAFRLADAWDAA